MPPTATPTRDYRRLLRRSRWLLLAGVVVGAAAALIVSGLETKVYTARADVAFQDVDQQTALIGGAARTPVETAAEIAAKSAQGVRQSVVLGAALRNARSSRSVADLAKDTSVSVDAGTNLVEVSVDNPDAATSARLADAVALAAVDYANREAQSRFRADASALRAELRAMPDTAANAVTRRSVEANLARLQTVAVVARPASIAQAASVPTSPSSPKPLFNAALGAILGLMVGFGIAFVREASDRKVRSSQEVGQELALPVLAQVSDAVMGSAPFLVTERDHAQHLAVANFGILRRNIELTRLDRSRQLVAVTSAAPQEGKTTVALSLACAFAAIGRRTALVEADLRRPALSERLGVSPAKGLGDYLAGEAELAEVSTQLRLPSRSHNSRPLPAAEVTCLHAGETRSDPDELLGSTRFGELLDHLAESYDAVVIDTSPLLPVADTLEILPLVDAYLVCVRSGQTQRQDIASLKETLARLPTPPVGAVATGLAEEDLEGYDYDYDTGRRRARAGVAAG